MQTKTARKSSGLENGNLKNANFQLETMHAASISHLLSTTTAESGQKTTMTSIAALDYEKLVWTRKCMPSTQHAQKALARASSS